VPIERLNGEDIYYEDHGEGTAIAFAHGGGGSHLDWWQQVLFFTGKGYRCITFDQRGCGFSGGGQAGTEGSASNQGQDVFKNDLLAILDHLGVEKAHVVGMSMGGWNCSGLALNHPERVRGLVMAGTTFGLPTPTQNKWAKWMVDQADAGVDVVGNSRKTPQQLRFREEQPQLAFLRHEFRTMFPPRSGVRGLDLYRQMAVQEPGNYSSFTVPTLFIVGEDDALQFTWLMDATAEAVPGSRLIHVPNAGHAVQYEAPDAFNEHVLGFFQSVEG
jgi:pimeloyl-ACP methyl ester carboxylesterase